MTEVAVIPQDVFNVARLSSIELPDSFEAALAAVQTINGGQVIDSSADVLADEWPEAAKKSLINVPFLAVTWSVSAPESSETGQYIVVRGMTKDGRRFRFADGSTGIMSQLVKLTRERVNAGHPAPNAGLLCEMGLSVSNYKTKDAAGKAIDAETFYIAS
jgi:hypothetical protein